MDEYFRLMILKGKENPKIVSHPEAWFYLWDDPAVMLDRYLFVSHDAQTWENDERGRPQFAVGRYIIDLETLKFANLDLGPRLYRDLVKVASPGSATFVDTLASWSRTWAFSELAWHPLELLEMSPEERLKSGIWKKLDLEEGWERQLLYAQKY